MPKFTGLEITKFRRLRNLHLTDLGEVNLLVGPNNSGKTSVLEALALLCHPKSFENWFSVAWEREIKSSRTSALESLKWLFPRSDDGKRDSLFSGEVEMAYLQQKSQPFRTICRATFQEQLTFIPEEDLNEPTRSAVVTLETPLDPKFIGPAQGCVNPVAGNVELLTKVAEGQRIPGEVVSDEFRYNRDPVLKSTAPWWPRLAEYQLVTPVSHRTKHEILHQLSEAIETGQKGAIVEALRELDPTIEGLDIVAPERGQISVRISRTTEMPSPLAVEGDGLRRLLSLTAAATAAKGGLLLVDEVETGLHTEALVPAFRYLVRLCRKLNVQLFVTTHSLEAVDALLAGMDGQPEDTVIHRLPPCGSGLAVKRMDGATARRIREEMGSELR